MKDDLDPILRELVQYYNYTPYVYDDSRIRYQMRGNPSGLLVTSLFNSFVNLVCLNYCHLCATGGRTTATGKVCVLGDDNLVMLTGFSKDQIIYFYAQFGLLVNKQKSERTEPGQPFSFIGYNWDEECRPTQSLSWYISHICLPSSFYRDEDLKISELMTYRAISVCFPLHDGVVNFNKVLGTDDRVYAEMLRKLAHGERTDFVYISSDRRVTRFYIPLKQLS